VRLPETRGEEKGAKESEELDEEGDYGDRKERVDWRLQRGSKVVATRTEGWGLEGCGL